MHQKTAVMSFQLASFDGLMEGMQKPSNISSGEMARPLTKPEVLMIRKIAERLDAPAQTRCLTIWPKPSWPAKVRASRHSRSRDMNALRLTATVHSTSMAR